MKDKTENDLDRHYPRTKPSTFLLYLLASPLLALGAWLVLLYLCIKES